MHAFECHLHEFVQELGDINSFNQQGHEKLNDMTSVQYFRGTNRHKEYLDQILNKRNRLEL